MNQILEIKKNKLIYIIQLYISLIIIIIAILLFIIYKFNLNKKETESEVILNNYSILKLYNNSQDYYKQNSQNNIIGIIEIPKLNISYPIFSDISDELLKISPCRVQGDMPYSISNLCIAGHNYNNDKFFSNINQLFPNDSIYIYNDSIENFQYTVTHNYEVENNDLSPLYDNTDSLPSLTLITCNNNNNKRIIIKAKIEN